MQELGGKTAVVTGSASGIGLAIATALVSEGMNIMMADRDAARLGREASALAPAPVETAVCDVSDPDALVALADTTVERFGAVHVLCNNAGIIRPGSTWELPLGDWEAVLRVNLFGVLYGIHAFVPRMIASGDEGHVVNVGSMASVVPVAGIGPYNVAKHAVLALSDTLRMDLELIDALIGVTTVMPGRVATRLGRPTDAPDPLPPAGDAPRESGVIEPDEVGRQVVEAIRGNRPYLFTHPERVADAERRFARITNSS